MQTRMSVWQQLESTQANEYMEQARTKLYNIHVSMCLFIFRMQTDRSVRQRCGGSQLNTMNGATACNAHESVKPCILQLIGADATGR